MPQMGYKALRHGKNKSIARHVQRVVLPIQMNEAVPQPHAMQLQRGSAGFKTGGEEAM